jgi:hypothetical protein
MNNPGSSGDNDTYVGRIDVSTWSLAHEAQVNPSTIYSVARPVLSQTQGKPTRIFLLQRRDTYKATQISHASIDANKTLGKFATLDLKYDNKSNKDTFYDGSSYGGQDLAGFDIDDDTIRLVWQANGFPTDDALEFYSTVAKSDGTGGPFYVKQFHQSTPVHDSTNVYVSRLHLIRPASAPRGRPTHLVWTQHLRGGNTKDNYDSGLFEFEIPANADGFNDKYKQQNAGTVYRYPGKYTVYPRPGQVVVFRE